MSWCIYCTCTYLYIFVSCWWILLILSCTWDFDFDDIKSLISNVELIMISFHGIHGGYLELELQRFLFGQEQKKKDPHIDAQVSMQVKTEDILRVRTWGISCWMFLNYLQLGSGRWAGMGIWYVYMFLFSVRLHKHAHTHLPHFHGSMVHRLTRTHQRLRQHEQTFYEALGCVHIHDCGCVHCRFADLRLLRVLKSFFSATLTKHTQTNLNFRPSATYAMHAIFSKH